MSKNHPHDNIYSILGKLDALKPTPEEKRFALVKEIRESIEAKGSITAGVSSVEAKLRQQFAESDFSKMSAAIQKTGKSKASADAITAAAGREKLGQKEMTRRSVAGRKDESYNPVKAVKQCAKDYMEMNGIHSVHNLEAEDIESIGGDCQMNYQDVCEILGCNLPDSLGPVKSYDEHGDMEECTGCAMGECSVHGMAEGEITRKPGVTTHTKTDFPGYPSDDLEKDDDDRTGPKEIGGRGRPRKAQTKNPRKDPNAPKKTVGRPSKEKPAVYAKHADPFGRVIGAVPTSKLPSRTHTMESVVQYVAESVNFKRMMEEQHMTLSEMLECMNADMQQFQETGVCSDRLRDMMEVYSHAKRQMEEEATKTVPPAAPARGIPGNVPVPGKMERLGGGRDYYEEDSDMLEAELSELARLAGITDEGNAFSGAVAKAKADGIQPGEKISVGGKEYPVKEADATVDDNEEELANTPHPKYGSIKAITTQGDDLNRQKRQDPHTANKAANPLTNVPTLEAKLAAEYESIKKVS